MKVELRVSVITSPRWADAGSPTLAMRREGAPRGDEADGTR